jgi:putative radical SAM enzyme (TIGR03279 family)
VLEIAAVSPGSTAAGLGLAKGDRILTVNGKAVRDIIDYQFLIADPDVVIKVQPLKGKKHILSLSKEPDDMLGLEFAPLQIKRCSNKCIFCFVDQMPPGCRNSLYVKDDDFRASFLYGNYITLGSLTESDWQRIFSERLSPLYISVHATDPSLRAFILGNKKTPDIMDSLRRLAEGGIRMHTQIVLCPEINDGVHLQKTLKDLSGLFPAVASVAVVPVGLTEFRKARFPLRVFTRREARNVVEVLTRFGDNFKKENGTRLVFASDEFYIKSGLPIPTTSFYEGFPQIENGVGMVSEFWHNAVRVRLPRKIERLRVTIVTGVSFSKILQRALSRLKSIEGLTYRQVVAWNSFFGASVTVAGLLTGSDIAKALTGKRLGDMVIIPAEALKAEEKIFLDGMSVAQLASNLGVRICTAADFKDIVSLLRMKGRSI